MRIGAKGAALAVCASLLGLPVQAQPAGSAGDVRTDTITANGVLLVYEDGGEGEPLVLVHGWAVHRGYWDGTAELLARDHRVIRYDRRGYGESGGRPDPTADPADLAVLLDSLGIRRAHVIGHSAGGGTARDFAARFPDRIGGLVLFGAGPPVGFRPGRGGMGEYFTELARLARSEGMDAVREAVLEMAAREFGGPQTLEIRERARRLVEAWQGWELLDPAAPSGMIAPLEAGELELIRAPTLVILGADEGEYAHLAADAYLYGIPDARKVVIPGGGHTVDWVEPERFAAEIVRFIRRSAPRVGAHRGLVDPAFWEAVVLGTDLRSDEISITIDPRLAHLEVGEHFPEAGDYRTEDQGAVAERRRILEGLGVGTGAAFPVRAGCDGILVPPSEKETHGCPDDPEIHVVFDRPDCDGECSVLRFTIRHSPAGRSATLSRIVLTSANTGWRVTGVEHLVEFD